MASSARLLTSGRFEKQTVEKAKEQFAEKKDGKEFESPLPQSAPQNPSGTGGSLEQRLSNLESSIAQLSHFINPGLRPDLSGSALRQEPDQGAVSQQPQKQAKDAEKQREG